MKYEELPKHFQEALNEAVQKVDGGTRYAIRAAFIASYDWTPPKGFFSFFKAASKRITSDFLARDYAHFADGWDAAAGKMAWLRGDNLEDPNAKYVELLEGDR